MKRMIGVFGMLLAFSASGLSQTVVEIDPVKELKPTKTLGTCMYKPTAGEDAFFKKLVPDEHETGSILGDYDIQKKQGYVSWCGIVRRITDLGGGRWRLLLEHKFFDGLTDCHIMLVDIYGSGDFYADVEAAELTIPALALVRVYGTIKGLDAVHPALAAEFIRVWPWMTFTFGNLMQKDRTNPRWKGVRSLDGRKAYRPWPDESYYRAVLGDPREYGLALKDK